MAAAPALVTVELDVDESAGSLAPIAYEWLDGVSRHMCPEARDAQAPSLAAVQPQAPAGIAWYADLKMWRRPIPGRTVLDETRKTASRKGMAWLRDELDSVLPYRVVLTIGPWHPDGDARLRKVLELSIGSTEGAPGWLRLSSGVDELVLEDPDRQRAWLAALRPFADRCNPGFGGIFYGGDRQTPLEMSWDPDLQPWQMRDPEYNLTYCRRYLRGYGWLTIVPQELARLLGGTVALRATGAFAEVDELSDGGIWLLATTDYRQFDDAALTRVFEAMAPVLRPGLPRVLRRLPDDPPQPVIIRDATELGAQSDR